jgi:hypothetical protein
MSLFVVIGAAACSSALSGEGADGGTDGVASNDSGRTGQDAAAGDGGLGDAASLDGEVADAAVESGPEAAVDAGMGDAGLDGARDAASDVPSDVRPMEASVDVGAPDVIISCPSTQPMTGARCYVNGLDCPYGKFIECLCESNDAGLHWQCVAF